MMLSSEKLSTYELCPRRYRWTDTYQLNRISVVGALYRALDAGLTGKDPEKAAENEFLALAATPGLDVTGRDVYSLAYHHAKLAGIISVALRSSFTEPWSVWETAGIENPQGSPIPWSSALYRAPDGIPRRVVLVDRWSDDRRGQEIRGWRTLGETLALGKPIMVTAVTIGASKDGRRHSAWTRCYRHPRNRTFRFKRKGAAEDFGANWERIWRENSDIATADWLTRMQNDDCMSELVQTVEVPPPARRGDFVREILRIGQEMGSLNGETPPMRLAGCFGFSPCPFLAVCYGKADPIPENYGFEARVQAGRISSSGTVFFPRKRPPTICNW